jgi:hypothetical protein
MFPLHSRDDSGSASRGNETRKLSLMPAIRVNSGTGWVRYPGKLHDKRDDGHSEQRRPEPKPLLLGIGF